MKIVIVGKCVVTHEAWYLSPPVCTCTYFVWTPPFLQLRTYLMHGLLNEKTNNNIQISYSLKYKHSKKEHILYEKKYQKTNSTMSVMLCTGTSFAKKSCCLVTRIVPYYIAGLHLLTFHILEPCPPKDIALGLSHVISH